MTTEFDWTYTRDPGNNPRDGVRLLIGDTNPASKLLSDGEIAYYLNVAANNPAQAALGALEAIIAQASYSAGTSQTVGSVSIQFGDRLGNLIKVRDLLRERLDLYGLPYCGGTSRSDSVALRSDADRIPPAFDNRGDCAWLQRPYFTSCSPDPLKGAP